MRITEKLDANKTVFLLKHWKEGKKKQISHRGRKLT